ncbi:MAG TPA: adenylate/guanylate cyclase domain-containing protein [Gaiellaceae bacterium]|nr:adenylate/guanylate cyclase domain-containing protein [Gaiellaceae bacterium]
MHCPTCGSENAESAKFCAECGASLAVATAARREERKVVSVVFVDLVGSTARAETSDPEDVRALLRVYHERARDELESFGGTVEKFIGDAVVAVFGAPVAHEDDPERAVRAALAVRDAVARLNEDEPDRDLHVRIAVNTGEALVSLDASPGEGEAMVAGDVINTAARIQSAAPVDGILVGEQTFRATEREIVYRDSDPVEAKGKTEPVLVWEAEEARSRLGVDLGGAGRASLVGRDRELDLLVDALQRTRGDRSTQLVTLVGVPGMGKSRLLYELGRVVDADEELITWRQGRSLPYGEGVSFWALGEIVKAQAGILESDPADVTETRLTEAVAVISDEGERTWIERHLRPLVGLGADDPTAGDRRGETFSAWRRFLEVLALGGPTVLVFEDIHWADDGLLDFIDGLVDWVDGVPLLVVCTARPELLERRPGWSGGKRNATTVSLAPLDDDETARLILALLGRSLLDADVQRQLVERAAGNPLYAEEFVRMLEAGGSVDGRLPETVQGIVAARIDLLPAEEKELLQQAAVLGKVFWSDALATVAGLEPWQLQDALRALERKEFVRRELRSTVAGATQHAFQHALVRDAAYGQIPRVARAARHVSAASWIESLPADRAEDRAETLAHHYQAAIDLYRAAGEDVSTLSARAVPALQEAGERALSLSAFQRAVEFLARALELVPDGEEPSAELLFASGKAFGFVGRDGDELRRAVDAFERGGEPERAAECAVVASFHLWHARPGEAHSWLERAAALVEGRPSSRAKALVLAEQARREMLNYNNDTARELSSQAALLAAEIGDDEIRADALVTGGVVAATGGDLAGIAMIEAALELVGHRGKVASRGYTNLYAAWATAGDARKARSALEQGLERAEREGDEQGAWFIRGNLLGLLYSGGDWAGALEMIQMFLDHQDQSGYQLNAARDTRARILEARGEANLALAEMHAVVDFAREIQDPQVLWPSLIAFAWLARRRGLHEESSDALAEVVDAIATSESPGDGQHWHVELVLGLEAVGRHADALEIAQRLADGPWRDATMATLERRYTAAADILASIGEEPLQAQVRLVAARELAREGRMADASAHLEQARAFWTSVGATAYLREADDVLAAAG